MRKKSLLFSITKKNFVIEWFSGSGAGGQHRNKSKNCCRIKHPESGAVAIGTEQRSREQNKKKAFERLHKSKKFQNWFKLTTSRALRDTPEEEIDIDKHVDDQMKEGNLKIEYGI